jgi:hypothetical protein
MTVTSCENKSQNLRMVGVTKNQKKVKKTADVTARDKNANN